jgi:hypothetical protein
MLQRGTTVKGQVVGPEAQPVLDTWMISRVMFGERDPISDDQGRIIFPALIPGATYRVIDRMPFRGPDGPQLRRDFTVKPGETLDLGDILIEKPQT